MKNEHISNKYEVLEWGGGIFLTIVMCEDSLTTFSVIAWVT